MFGPPRSQIPHMRWGIHHPPHSPQWRHPFEPRVPFHGQHGQQQRFNHSSPLFQSGNDNFWCETCDRGFPTEDILNRHKQQHQKCNIDGCQFIAHPKVITKHIQMQHSTGLFKKIANLKNPEEIQKWREERKRRYPTKSNIEKKAAELKEKINRGEKMGLEKDRSHRNQPNPEQESMPGQGIKRKFNKRNENQARSKFKRNETDNNNKNVPRKPKPTPIVEDNRLKPFAGILNLQTDSDSEIENECEELNALIEDDFDSADFKSIETDKVTEITKPVVCGALSSLMCDYGSSEEEDNSEIVNTESKNTIQPEVFPNQNRNALIEGSELSIAERNSLISKCDAKENIENIKDSVHTQPTDVKINAKMEHQAESKKDPMGLVQNANNKDDESNKLEKVAINATITSIPVENGQICIENSNDSEPDKLKTKLSTNITHATEGNGQIKCEDEFKESAVQETSQIGDDSDSGPEEIKAEISKEDSSVLEETKPTDVRKKVIKGRPQVYQRRRPKLPSTLLQKLLSKEMQQERNIILQCIRYIRRNHYFDKNE